MVSKCANPACGVPFRYLHTGQLFRVETAAGFERRRSMGRDAADAKPLRRLEFFWLCENCARGMTVMFDKDVGVTVRARNYVLSAAA